MGDGQIGGQEHPGLLVTARCRIHPSCGARAASVASVYPT